MSAFIFNLAHPMFNKLAVTRVPAIKPMPTPPAGWRISNFRTGYPAHLRNETNDCTVRAAQRVLRLDYESAHDMLRRHGRKPRRGFRFWTIAKPEKTGLIDLGIKGGRVESFLKRADRSKRYVIKVRGHVLAACDGIIFDTPSRLRQHVKAVWVVQEPNDFVI